MLYIQLVRLSFYVRVGFEIRISEAASMRAFITINTIAILFACFTSLISIRLAAQSICNADFKLKFKYSLIYKIIIIIVVIHFDIVYIIQLGPSYSYITKSILYSPTRRHPSLPSPQFSSVRFGSVLFYLAMCDDIGECGLIEKWEEIDNSFEFSFYFFIFYSFTFLSVGSHRFHWIFWMWYTVNLNTIIQCQIV